ncbi:hypothetical protein ACWEQ8_07330 [Streptomyces noursei]
MKPVRLTFLTALALLAPAALATPANAATPTAAPPLLSLTNPDFEQGQYGWAFTTGTGVASNRPHRGTKLVYLDAGAGKKVSQTVTATGTGSYDISAWISTSDTGGAFTARVNGNVVQSQSLPSASNYRRYTLSRIALAKGDKLEVAFESGKGWVNADDLMVSPSAPVNPTVTSSDPKIKEMFDWARLKANSWTQQQGSEGPLNIDEYQSTGTGSGTYASSYWAGYAYRSAYYSRDMAHQLAGASVLGLDSANKTMLGSFAASATDAHNYYPVWSFNFDAKTYLSIDYHNPDSFVREVPATFELVEKADEAYRWTGDTSYVDDPVMWDFYRHATKEFIERHDSVRKNGVAEGTGQGIFKGAASYNEQSGEPLAEAGDAIGSQYQAFLAMASLARGKGDAQLAQTYEKKAADLKTYFNTQWSGSGSGANMIRGYTTDGRALTGWGKENSWFMPMKQIIDPGARRDAYLDFIDQQASGAGKPSNIEAITYLPDTFFKNNRNDTAWKWMNYVFDQKDVQHPVANQGTNGDYPEVSFTLLSQTVEGLMGVTPNAPANSLTTQSRLPKGMDWLKIDDIRVGGNTFSLRHDGATKSVLTNSSGTAGYTWEARFPGTFSAVKVNGVQQTAQTKVVDGATYTYVTPNVAPGQTITVEAIS